MNKLFTKIASLALGAAMAFGVGVAVSAGRNGASPAEATDYNTPTNYSLASAVPSGLTASTSLTRDSSGRGMGKAGATYTLTTSTSFTDVGKIVVNAATNYGTYSAHSVSATVGGSAFGSAQSFTAKASTNYTIEASKASGVVVVSLNNGKAGTTKTNTIWCLSIDIYTVATPVQTYTVSFAVNTAGYGTVSQSSITSVASGSSITTNGNQITIGSTTVTATPTASTAEYEYSFTGWTNNTGSVTADRTITANFSRAAAPSYSSVTVTGGSQQGTDKGSAYIQCSASATGTNIPASPSFTWYVTETNTYGTTTSVANKASIDNTGKVTFDDNCTVYVWALAPDGSTHNTSGYAATASGLIDPKGSESNPYTCAEARSIATTTANNTHVRGIIYNVASYSSTYHSLTYWISDDGTGDTSNKDGLQIYSGKGLNGADFSSTSDLTVGSTVVVQGDLKVYQTTTYELDKNSVIKSIVLPKSLSSIAVKTAPSKTAYKSGESFDPTGLVITATYSDTTTEDIPYAGHSGAFTFSPSTITAAGNVTITYQEKTCSQAVSLVTVTNVTSVESAPTVAYVGGSINPSDVTLNVTYSDSSVGTVHPDTVTCDLSSTGPATATATYNAATGTKSATFDITVIAAPLEYQVTFGTAEGTTGISDFSNTTIVCPSQVTLNNIIGNVYGSTTNAQVALRFGKSGTTGSFDASISGNYYITSVKCNLKYYGSDTTATFAVTPDGGSAISKSLTGDWADYTYDVSSAKAKTVTLGTDVNGKRAFLSGFTISYTALKTLSNISLSGTYPTSFTKGDTFSHAGMVVTANYSDSTSATVTASATWSSPDMSTPGAKTITVSYSDEYGSASQTYSITVSYANPTGIALSLNSKKLSLLEEFAVADVDVTINPEATADQSEYEWVVQDEDGLVADDTYVFSDGVFYAMAPADAFVLRCQSTKAGYAATVYADVTIEITGDPIAHIKDEGDHDVTEGSTTIFADAGIISYSVEAENFEGTLTYTWSSSNTSAISVDAAADEICDFEVKAAGSARLSCRIQGSVKGDVTVYTDVTVSAVTVSSVTWTAPTIDVFSGATLSQADVTSWNVKYSTNSGKTDQTAPAADIVIKLGGSAISIGHEWVAADSGKALSVEYGNVAAASTGSVTVTQTINAVYAPVAGDPSTSTLTFSAACGGSGTSDGGETWTVTSDGTESTYDPTKGIHYGTNGAAVQYINLTSSDFTTGKITSVVVNASTASGVTATVAVNVGGSAFGGAAKSLSQTATAYTFEGDVDADEIEVIITKPSSATKAIYCKSIAVTYVEESEEKVNIANVAAHKAAQRAAVAFAQAFNAAMDETENCTTGLDAAWSTCSSAYDSFCTAAAALGETEEAWAKNLVKYATRAYSDDSGEACLERMMKTYEICVQKHGKTAFMSDLVTLGRVVTPVNVISNSGTEVAIIVVTSMIGLSAVGGYFFLRKRKENI